MTTSITLGQPLAKALLLFTATDKRRNLDRVALRVDAHGAQWEATDGNSLLIFRPDAQPEGLGPGVYAATREAVARCAGIPRKYRVEADDLVTVEPATDWPDVMTVCPLLTGRKAAPVNIDGALLARLHGVGRALCLWRRADWSLYAGDDIRSPVVCLPSWTPGPAGKLMVLLMPMVAGRITTAAHRTSDGWTAAPRTPQHA